MGKRRRGGGKGGKKKIGEKGEEVPTQEMNPWV